MVRISKGILIGLWIVCFIYACALNITGSDSWKCEVTLTLGAQDSVNKRIGRGTGTGKTHQEARNAAYRIACSQLSLSDDLRQRCESGERFASGEWSEDCSTD